MRCFCSPTAAKITLVDSHNWRRVSEHASRARILRYIAIARLPMAARHCCALDDFLLINCEIQGKIGGKGGNRTLDPGIMSAVL